MDGFDTARTGTGSLESEPNRDGGVAQRKVPSHQKLKSLGRVTIEDTKVANNIALFVLLRGGFSQLARELRQVKYPKTMVELNHHHIKRLVKPRRGLFVRSRPCDEPLELSTLGIQQTSMLYCNI